MVRKEEVLHGPGGRVRIMDSITQIDADDAGCYVVSGSHGGTSSGQFALEVPLAAAVFNDAGVGKDAAGIAALAMLEAQDIPAIAIAHTSARIGDSADAWANGIVSHLNRPARALGLAPGDRLREALTRLVGDGAAVSPYSEDPPQSR